MVVVGPEDPLVKGVYDYFKKDEALSSIPVIGPSGEGAQLEGSKDFAKAFMMRHHIPTARYKSISTENLEEGYAFLESLSAPYVLKADGLAAGKGVLIIMITWRKPRKSWEICWAECLATRARRS